MKKNKFGAMASKIQKGLTESRISRLGLGLKESVESRVNNKPSLNSVARPGLSTIQSPPEGQSKDGSVIMKPQPSLKKFATLADKKLPEIAQAKKKQDLNSILLESIKKTHEIRVDRPHRQLNYEKQETHDKSRISNKIIDKDEDNVKAVTDQIKADTSKQSSPVFISRKIH